ncbi:quinone-dependent dihydroorotate dehydrogenase [Brevirhabdus sp.]|uniref:quinone-dependent dihydroorotate dehydrogenase n=1 Tax=Brevirhabdus sp. TaxID=2004514 RepID=UPI004058FE60
MRLREKLALAMLHRIDPERAHTASINALRAGMMPSVAPVTSTRLATRVAGLSLRNPVGLAAGFDKNAQVLGPLVRSGFGFVEVGAATPLPQPGNPRPRLFRLSESRAAINRFGFNNDGAERIARRLAGRPSNGVIGLNLGANKTSTDRARDYVRVLETCGRHIDFATINVSSPNTEKLRDLQGPEALSQLVRDVVAARDALGRRLPLLLKIAPDLTPTEIEQIADSAIAAGIDAIVATNTTLARDDAKGRHAAEAGGLSGAPLFNRSTRVLARLSLAVDGRVPLIGVGGISSAQDAYAKILAGASAVQLYTALIYGGLSLASEIATGLDRLLERDGFANVAQAVGAGRHKWL